MCVSSWRLPSKENLPQKWFWVFARCLISVCVCVDGRHTCETQSRNRCVADIWMKVVAFQARGGRAGSWGRLTYCSGCSRETLQVRGRRWRWSTEHLCRDVTAENWWIRTWTCRHETHCWRESNCRMISNYFLWSVLTYIWFIYNTTLFISSLKLKKTFTGCCYLTPLSMMFVQTWLTDGLRFACAGKYVSSYFHQLSPAQIEPVGKHWSKNKNLYRETTKTAPMSGEMSCKEPTTHIKKLIKSIRYRGLLQLNSTSEVKPSLRLCIFKLSQLHISFLVLLRVK